MRDNIAPQGIRLTRHMPNRRGSGLNGAGSADTALTVPMAGVGGLFSARTARCQMFGVPVPLFCAAAVPHSFQGQELLLRVFQ